MAYADLMELLFTVWLWLIKLEAVILCETPCLLKWVHDCLLKHAASAAGVI